MPETVISVASTAVALMAKSKNITAEVVAFSVLSNSSLPGCIVNEALGGMGSKADTAYKYAMDHYTLGLPNCSIGGLAAVEPELVQGIIESEVGQSVTIEYAFIDTLSERIAVMPFLAGERNYNPVSNAVTSYPFELLYPNDDPLIVADIVISGSSATITYTHRYTTGDGGWDAWETFEETVSVDSNLTSGGTFCIAFYYLSNGSSGFWYYNMADGSHPELDVQFEGFGLDAFMPVIPLRHNNVDLTTIDDELYQTSKRLLRKLNLNIKTIAESINSNPDIDSIDHAYVMFGVPANTTDIPSLRYLTEYFHYLSSLQKYSELDRASAIINGETIPKTILRTDIYRSETNLPVDVSLSEHGLNIQLAFDYITTNTISGSIGKKGFASSEIVVSTQEVEFETAENNVVLEIDNSSITYRHQLNAGEYREVVVHVLIHTNNIYQNHSVETTIATAQEEGNTNLIIPIHYGVASKLQVFQRNELYNNSLTLILNSYVETKLEWYQSTWFKIVVMIVGIVLTMVSYGGAGEGLASLMNLLQYVAVAVVINYAFKMAVKYLGSDWALVIAAVAIIIYMYTGYKDGSINFVMPTAQTCLQAAVSVLTFIGKSFEYALAGVSKEFTDFQTSAEDKTKSLEAAQDLLDMEQNYNPLNFLRKPAKLIFPIESPDAFFERTIHTGNIGAAVLDVIGNYCDIMLKLPEVNYS